MQIRVTVSTESKLFPADNSQESDHGEAGKIVAPSLIWEIRILQEQSISSLRDSEELYIPSQNGINNGLTEEDISNTEENCKNFNINLSRRKTGGEETKKDVAVLKLEDDNTLTTTARRYKACQSSSVNYERQTQPEDEKDSSLQQHVRVPAESDKVAPKIAGSFGKKSEFDKIDEARRVKEETTGPMLSGEKERRINNLTEMSSKRKTLPRKESLYQKQSVVGTTRKISREDSYIVMEQSQDFKQKFRLTNSDLEKLIELGY